MVYTRHQQRLQRELEAKNKRQQKYIAAVAHNPSIILYRLAHELRNRIYRLVLPKPNSINIENDASFPLVLRTGEIIGTKRHREPSILSSCALARSEAAAIYYGQQCFEFRDSAPHYSRELRQYSCDPARLVAWLDALDTYALPVFPHVRSMVIKTHFTFVHGACSAHRARQLRGDVTFKLTTPLYCTTVSIREVDCECDHGAIREEMDMSFQDLESKIVEHLRKARATSSSPVVTFSAEE